jgi:NADPH:quinone reductase-like Zn-dependent oxidoreductase
MKAIILDGFGGREVLKIGETKTPSPAKGQVRVKVAATSVNRADIILDHIGAAYLESNMKSLAYEGRLVVIGVVSGATAQLNLAHMMVKRQSIIGSVIRSRSVEEKGEITARFDERVLPKFVDRTLVPLIYNSFPLDQVAEAHWAMEESRHFGKIVLKITHE